MIAGLSLIMYLTKTESKYNTYQTTVSKEGKPMKCKHCGNEIKQVEIHLVYFKDIDRINDAKDLYDDYDYFEETTFHCPQCGAHINDEELCDL